MESKHELPAQVKVRVRIAAETNSVYIDHTDLFRHYRAPLSEFSELTEVLSRLSVSGHARLHGQTVLEWSYNTAELDHIKFVIDKYSAKANWYKVVYVK